MQTPIERLLAIMAQLRDPEGGCPWDLEQTFATIAPHTIEEAYEVDDAIRRGDLDGLREELGDVLLQVVFHAQMAREAGLFDFDAVVATLVDKLVRRHPHVFGDADVADAEAQTRLWEDLKAAERAEKAVGAATPSALDGVALGLPALLRAQKLVRRATRAGLDVEVTPIDAAWEAHRAAGSAESLGALLFALAQAAALDGTDAEIALREATARLRGAGASARASALAPLDTCSARRARAASAIIKQGSGGVRAISSDGRRGRRRTRGPGRVRLRLAGRVRWSRAGCRASRRRVARLLRSRSRRRRTVSGSAGTGPGG